MGNGRVVGCCLLVVLALSGCEADGTAAPVTPTSPPAVELTEPEVVFPVAVVPTRPPAARPATALLHAAAGGDGDSWKDTAGHEYRLGLVNTPESSECFGATATAKRKDLVADGFRARVYTRDSYGREVSVVTLADGRNLNVLLARQGYANDKYLAQFRSENPSLAAQLDGAFAAAKREKAGLWGACAAAPAAPQGFVAQQVPPAAADSSCHPDYATCIPVKGDGSGRGEVNDLDCGDIGKRVQLRQVGVDPYRLDADGNGIGCESS